jgi:hypothetical protein
MAGDDSMIQAMALGALLAAGAPGVYGTYDVFTGDTHGFNSGELPLNALIAGLPLATGTAGGIAAYALSPSVRAASDGVAMAVQALQSRGTVPTPQQVAAMKQAASSFQRNAAEAAAREQRLDPGIDMQEAIRRAGMRGRRNMVGSAFAGTTAGAIPAVMLMQDRPSGEA